MYKKWLGIAGLVFAFVHGAWAAAPTPANEIAFRVSKDAPADCTNPT